MSKFKLKDDFTWRDFFIRMAIVVGTVALIIWVLPRDGRTFYHVEAGKLWRYSDFKAPFDFPIYKSDNTVKAERDSLLKTYEPYYEYNDEVEGAMVRKFVVAHQNGIPGLPKDYISVIANRLHSLYQKGIISSPDYSKLTSDTARNIRVVSGKKAQSIPIRDIYSTKSAYEKLFADELLEPHRAILQKCDLNEYISPNLIYDKERSTSSLNDMINSIPLASGVVQKGQKIVDRGEVIDETTARILLSFEKENEKRNQNSSQIGLSLLGESLFVSILVICFTIYLTLFRKDYFEKARSIAMLYSLIIIFFVMTSLMVRNSFGHVYMVPYAMVPIFIRIFMDSRTAFITHITLILLCSCMLQHPFDFIIIETVAGMAAIYSLRELQYRSQLFKTAIVVTLAAMLMEMAVEMMNTTMSEFDWSNYNYLIINGILLLFAYPLLYVIEKAFGFISDITLIELSNTNNPILRKLSEVAPGTFQHSIQVGNLAAEIANKIGAKSQLVRTGALYHDIGKMSNPVYFTENQRGINPHEGMSYIDSAQIIISHVTEGLKIADKYDLPEIIRGFISTHHGQGKAKYFFVKYKNENPDDNVDELLFTYPGPNPFTREQAILMMADSVEAASRSLPDYTEKSIRQLVDNIIDSIVAQGFFKECPITFRDIAYAKTVLIEKLKTIYHTRVSYPEFNKDKQEQ